METEKEYVSITEDGIKVDKWGKDIETGRYVKGFVRPGPGRPKGSRNKLVLGLLSKVEGDDVKPEDVLRAIYMDSDAHPELRLRAASKLLDYVYPKAASVQVEVEDNTPRSIEELNSKIVDLLANAQARQM